MARVIRYALPCVCSFAIGVLMVDTGREWQEVKAKPKLAAREEVFRAVLCPPNWKATIEQEYLDRDRKGIVTKRTRIRYCI